MKREYPDYPILGVGGIVFLDDKIVLVKRGKEPGYGRWGIPGGAVKLGENMEQAVKREILEETNIDVDVIKIVKVIDPIIRSKDNRVKYHYVLVDFLCKYKSGRLRPDSDVLDARAVLLSELADYDLPEITQEVIKEASAIHLP
ncbi:MAG: NUDIX hydrolase [Thermodesulfobacteriota bacterium]|nr:NUDIX hydrolase [Thermodesulfobacteriota bacterium]